MQAFRIALTVIFIILSIALAAIILMQEGKTAGFLTPFLH